MSSSTSSEGNVEETKSGNMKGNRRPSRRKLNACSVRSRRVSGAPHHNGLSNGNSIYLQRQPRRHGSLTHPIEQSLSSRTKATVSGEPESTALSSVILKVDLHEYKCPLCIELASVRAAGLRTHSPAPTALKQCGTFLRMC